MRNFLIKAILFELYLLSYISVATCQTSKDNSRETEKSAVKQSVRAFLKWYELTGDKLEGKIHLADRLILNKYKKPISGPDDLCPCVLNEQTVNAHVTWLKTNARFISLPFIETYKREMTEAGIQLKKAKIYDEIYEAEETIYVLNNLVYVGNGGTPEFSKEGFYADTDKIKWSISFESNNKVIIVTTAPGSPYTPGDMFKMRIEMVKENGLWKLAKQVGTTD